MKSALLVFVILVASIVILVAAAYSQTPIVPPNTHGPGTSPPTVITPAPKPQPVIEAGGLDNLCQSGLRTHYNMNDKGGFRANNAKESQALSNASECVGYITGWEHTISGAFVMEENRLWYVEVDKSFTTLKEVDALHEYLKANPEVRLVASPLVLLSVAVDKNMATVSPVEIKDLPQPQDDQTPTPPPLKSST